MVKIILRTSPASMVETLMSFDFAGPFLMDVLFGHYTGFFVIFRCELFNPLRRLGPNLDWSEETRQ